MADTNKFEFHSALGDPTPYHESPPDPGSDFSQDSAGVPNPDQGEKTNMDMGLKPNMFPRQTGHDSLTEEEAQLS